MGRATIAPNAPELPERATAAAANARPSRANHPTTRVAHPPARYPRSQAFHRAPRTKRSAPTDPSRPPQLSDPVLSLFVSTQGRRRPRCAPPRGPRCASRWAPPSSASPASRSSPARWCVLTHLASSLFKLGDSSCFFTVQVASTCVCNLLLQNHNLASSYRPCARALSRTPTSESSSNPAVPSVDRCLLPAPSYRWPRSLSSVRHVFRTPDVSPVLHVLPILP